MIANPVSTRIQHHLSISKSWFRSLLAKKVPPSFFDPLVWPTLEPIYAKIKASSTPEFCPILSGKFKVVVKTTVTVPGCLSRVLLWPQVYFNAQVFWDSYGPQISSLQSPRNDIRTHKLLTRVLLEFRWSLHEIKGTSLLDPPPTLTGPTIGRWYMNLLNCKVLGSESRWWGPLGYNTTWGTIFWDVCIKLHASDPHSYSRVTRLSKFWYEGIH